MAVNDSITCTPNALLDVTPCFQCLTQTELLQVLILSSATLAGYDLSEDLNQLVEDSACMTCMSDKQMLEALVAIWANYALSDTSMDTIRSDIKCLLCVDPHRLKAMLLYVMCQAFQPVAN